MKEAPPMTYTVCVNFVADDVDREALVRKLSRFCRGASKEEIELAIQSPPFSFRRMNFDSAQTAKDDLERLGCRVDIREGSGVSSPEETVLFHRAKQRHSTRMAKDVDEELLQARMRAFASDDREVEAYRTLRTNILVTIKEEGRNAFLITSASPGEGKSTVVANLGIALASAGKKTILVDMDLRQPVLHLFMGVDNSLGLSNVVFDDLDPDAAISHTAYGRLHLLPSGPIQPNPAELLSSKAVRELLEALAEQFDVVLVDSPPAVGLTDAVVIGSIIGDAFLVVRAGHTIKQQAALAVRMLEDVKCRVLGAILNEVDLTRPYYRVYSYSRIQKV